MHRFIHMTVVLLIISGFVTRAYPMERFDIITTEEIKQMLEKREAGKIDFILVNALDEIIFRNSSIPGSINVPWSRIDETAHRLGVDKEQLIVTY